MTAVLRLLLGNEWLTGRRVAAWSAILLGLELVTLAVMVAGTHGLIVRLDRPASTDFVSFYAAGDLADAGHPELAYSVPDHYAAEQRAAAPGITYNYFYYPPVFLLLCAPLARLPYLPAFLLFAVGTLAAFVAVARRVIGREGWRDMLPLLAFPALPWTLGIGQNALLTASLFGFATLLVDRRPLLAGLCFGALCYKPHFGVLVPVALAAGGHWRAFAAAAASAALLVLLSVLAFGLGSWRAFFAAFAAAPALYQSGRIGFAGMISVFGAARLAGLSPSVAYGLQAIAALLAAATVAWLWRCCASLPVRAAGLLAATLAAVPLALFYELMLAALAGAWLVREARQGGYLLGEKPAFAAIAAVALVSRGLGMAVPLGVGPLVPLGLLALCVGHARRERWMQARPLRWERADGALPVRLRT
ncbi:MAG: DUF2029 domain-containing protein [Acidisphaera sp.]|nr:DUF2029 domain-containing protein [Acidisphaera sp.]